MAPLSFLQRIFSMLPSRLTAHVLPHAFHVDVVVLSGFPRFFGLLARSVHNALGGETFDLVDILYVSG